MKRCPLCDALYPDDELNFCRTDGASLLSVFGAVDDEAETLRRLSYSSEVTLTAIFPTADRSTSATLTNPVRKRKSRTSRTIDSLAVLPLAGVGADAQTDYLCEGITETLINSLSQLPRLRVVPRTTAFRYRGTDIDPQEAGRELGVRAVLSGRLQQVGDWLVIKVELIDIDRESHLWGEQYRRRLTDIFDVQEEIATDISGKLQVKLRGRKRIAARPTANSEAYHLYLKGRYHTNKRTFDWIKKGIEFFQQAIDLDPNYALAYAGLADAYAFLSSSTGECPPSEFYPKAQAAALRALELDPRLAEAHTSLGFYRLMYEWDFAGAERAFKRALALDPGYSNAHDGYGFFLKATGRFAEAAAACRHMQKLDPLSLFSYVSLSWTHYFAGEYDAAIDQCRRAVEMDPRFVFAYWSYGLAQAQLGELSQAITTLETARELSGGGLAFTAHLGYVYGLAGKYVKAEGIRDELEDAAKKKYVSAYYFSIVDLGLKQTANALNWLEKAFQERSGFLAFLGVEPIFHPLRDHPRFLAVRERIGPAAGG